MTNPEGGIRASQDLSVDTARKVARDDIMISAWEAVLNKERSWEPVRGAVAVYDEQPFKAETNYI